MAKVSVAAGPRTLSPRRRLSAGTPLRRSASISAADPPHQRCISVANLEPRLATTGRSPGMRPLVRWVGQVGMPRSKPGILVPWALRAAEIDLPPGDGDPLRRRSDRGRDHRADGRLGSRCVLHRIAVTKPTRAIPPSGEAAYVHRRRALSNIADCRISAVFITPVGISRLHYCPVFVIFLPRSRYRSSISSCSITARELLRSRPSKGLALSSPNRRPRKAVALKIMDGRIGCDDRRPSSEIAPANPARVSAASQPLFRAVADPRLQDGVDPSHQRGKVGTRARRHETKGRTGRSRSGSVRRFRPSDLASGSRSSRTEAAPGRATRSESLGRRTSWPGTSWPTNTVAQDLKADGFVEALTMHAELFRLKNGRAQWNARTVIILDDAAMLDSRITGVAGRGAPGRRQGDPRRRRAATRQDRVRRPI